MHKRNAMVGVSLAILAALIWSGNFIIARSESTRVPPISLAFYRWACAALLFTPIGWRSFWQQRQLVRKGFWPIFFAALFGISLFNTFVYVAGHHSSAINLALIGTTSSPIFSLILARIFLKEPVPMHRWAGLVLCFIGILLLISKGQWSTLLNFRFTAGDGWILLAAFSFAVYNIFTRKKPAGILPVTYLFTTFWLGCLLLLPFFLIEQSLSLPVIWNLHLVGVILYLGLGTSVIAFYCWNAAIARLGAARTALFGNLIPVFSSLEAVVILHETLTPTHLWGMLVICCGLLLANAQLPKWLTTRKAIV